jgi:hypothetical protein
MKTGGLRYIALAAVLLLTTATALSCRSETSVSKAAAGISQPRQVAAGSSSNRLSTASPSQSRGAGDSVASPDAIIYHKCGKNLVIDNKAQFIEVVRLVNKRLRGAKITADEQWADFDVTPAISGIDSLEFDYSQLNVSSFEYDGPHSSPARAVGATASQAAVYTRIQYIKLIFPLADTTVSGSVNTAGSFSVSVFSSGDPSVIKYNVNGRDAAPVFKISPIGAPDDLIAYLKVMSSNL